MLSKVICGFQTQSENNRKIVPDVPRNLEQSQICRPGAVEKRSRTGKERRERQKEIAEDGVGSGVSI